MDPDMNKYDTRCGDGASQDESDGIGGRLSRRLGPLLHAGTSGMHHAPSRCDWHQSQLARRNAVAFFPIHRSRERPPPCRAASSG